MTVTDNGGCSASTSIIITQPAALVSTETFTNGSCGSLGSITVTTNGGTTNYTYAWSDGGEYHSSRTNLATGSYTVTVSDAHLCKDTLTQAIANSATLIANLTSTNASSCTGGKLNASPNGGTGPFTYAWSDGPSTSQNRTNVPAGSYTVTITDANACTGSASATITQAPALSVTLASQTNVLCFGGSTGAINVTISGGATPYQYAWSDLVFTQNRSNIPAGTYTFGVMDADSCTATLTVTITQPAAALTATQADVDASCNGSNDGSITITANGGTTPYTYAWSDGGSTIRTVPASAQGHIR